MVHLQSANTHTHRDATESITSSANAGFKNLLLVFAVDHYQFDSTAL